MAAVKAIYVRFSKGNFRKTDALSALKCGFFTFKFDVICPENMIFLTVVACEIGRNSYFAGTDQRAGSGVWWELWVICCTNSDPLEI